MTALSTALMAIWRHRLRSSLIMLTVAIGITAVTTTVSLTDGLQTYVTGDIQKAGRAVSAVHRDLFKIAALLAGGRMPEKRLALKYSDLAAITRDLPTARSGGRNGRDVPVTFVPAETAYAMVRMEQGSGKKSVLVGTVPDYRVTISYGLKVGRHLSWKDVTERHTVCTIDLGRARDLWGPDVDPDDCLGRMVELTCQGTDYRLEVVGVLAEPFRLREKFKAFDTVRHARPAIFDRLNLLNIYVPITLLVDTPQADAADTVTIGGLRFTGEDSATGMLMYFGDCTNRDIKAYEDRLKSWAKERKLGIFIVSQWLWLQLVEEMVGDADMVGGLIWAVILGVTIVMIAVINLVVVRERFREVAIRRTEGARRFDILAQFILESCLLSLGGGMLGIVGGMTSARILSEEVTEWPPEFNPGTFVLAIAASLSVGVLSTALPAWQAARLDPVKVLSKP